MCATVAKWFKWMWSSTCGQFEGWVIEYFMMQTSKLLHNLLWQCCCWEETVLPNSKSSMQGLCEHGMFLKRWSRIFSLAWVMVSQSSTRHCTTSTPCSTFSIWRVTSGVGCYNIPQLQPWGPEGTNMTYVDCMGVCEVLNQVLKIFVPLQIFKTNKWCPVATFHSTGMLAEPLWSDPGIKSGTCVRELTSTLKKTPPTTTNRRRRRSAGGEWMSEWSNILPKSS